MFLYDVNKFLYVVEMFISEEIYSMSKFEIFFLISLLSAFLKREQNKFSYLISSEFVSLLDIYNSKHKNCKYSQVVLLL